MNNYYAVKVGNNPGVYTSIEVARNQIQGYPNAVWQGFDDYYEAEDFAGVKKVLKTHYVVKNMVFDSLAVARRNATGSYIQECLSLQDAEYHVSRNGYTSYQKRLGDEIIFVNTEGRVITQVFTDGACAGNGQPDAAAGVGVYFGVNNSRNHSSRLNGAQTSQRAELAAIKMAYDLIAARKDGFLYEICTDSAYAIDCLTKWCITWRQNGWINAKGHPVVNRDLIEAILDLNQSVRNVIGLKKVQAHSGLEGNEEADRLAKEGIYK